MARVGNDLLSSTCLSRVPFVPVGCSGKGLTTYGVLGVGSIATSIVTGLCDGVVAPPLMRLSPRNAVRSADLARRFPTVRVAASNQDVVDSSDVVLLCLLPNDAEHVLSMLRFRKDQSVVSAMAGISLSRLRPLLSPATDIARSVPVPSVATRAGTTPVHPATPAAVKLYGLLGGPMPIDDEGTYESLSVASATVAAHFDYLRAVADWLEERGMPPSQARRYVGDHFAGLAPELASASLDFSALASAHSTSGGLNEQFARHMQAAGLQGAVRDGLDALLARISGA